MIQTFFAAYPKVPDNGQAVHADNVIKTAPAERVKGNVLQAFVQNVILGKL